MEHCDDQGEQSKRNIDGSGTLSAVTQATLEKVKCRRRGRSMKAGTKCLMLDNTFPGYGWLLPGWVAEERHMETGRIYRYYYDPEGRMYRSQHEVIHAWENSGMVVLDM
ncbi:hypothetical protein Pint_06314 [Pistacia integerrima]|uniref:Uncharacterized protein n=2 Tax=Pistacia TaxID=55512 RepID=A0ACC1BRN5_9ROSI|nr:hypothetical protein Pint_06314 [Pistacia integerrima]KAJ0101604.1 hypothetical protein Patl1_06395 [Pistacia atlantica]